MEAATVMLRAKISGLLWWVWSLEMPAWQAWMKEEVGLRHCLPYSDSIFGILTVWVEEAPPIS